MKSQWIILNQTLKVLIVHLTAPMMIARFVRITNWS